MRIADQTIRDSALRTLQAQLAVVARYQEEAATGRRVNTPSDDPGDAARIMRLDGQLRDLAQYRRNQATAVIRMSAEDAVLTTVREALAAARHLAMTATAPSPADPLRQAAAAEARAIRDQLVALGNTRMGNEYIFGGTATDVPPFLADGTYVGNGQVRQVEIDQGALMNVGHAGGQVVGGALQEINALIVELETGTPQTIAATVPALEQAETAATGTQAELGGQLRQIRQAGSDLARRTDNLLDQHEALRDVPAADALVRLVTAQTALERAYEAVSRAMSTSLVEYLR
jgi:flagellar hook-associated protein 3 FlgL